MSEITVYGAPWCPDCKRSKKFLTEHRVTYNWVDIDQDAEALATVERLQGGGRSIPTIVLGNGEMLVEPSNDELARKLGLNVQAKRSFYDLAIVGGGPAGLAAAIYAAREGINAVVIEKSGLGGQAATTAIIDNYPGFPEGIGGAELMERFEAQARRYDVELLPAVGVAALSREGDGDGNDIRLTLGSRQEVVAHAVIIATGSTYRRLNVPGESELIGSGVHFCSTCDGPFYRGSRELLVIGGGNSAMEEALHLAEFTDNVRIAVRGPDFTGSPLVREKLMSHDKVTVHFNIDITALTGNGRLDAVQATDLETGETYAWSPAGAFVFIGLRPNTDFLDDAVARDSGGFVTADNFHTSMPGVFVAGDVRAGSTKQLGSAVGEGVAALLAVRQYLEQHRHLASS